MPFKDRKNPERYDHGGADDDEAMEVEMQKLPKNKVRPYGGKKIGMRDSELDKLKGLSKADQQRKMYALAHQFSYFGLKADKENNNNVVAMERNAQKKV